MRQTKEPEGTHTRNKDADHSRRGLKNWMAHSADTGAASAFSDAVFYSFDPARSRMIYRRCRRLGRPSLHANGTVVDQSEASSANRRENGAIEFHRKIRTN